MQYFPSKKNYFLEIRRPNKRLISAYPIVQEILDRSPGIKGYYGEISFVDKGNGLNLFLLRILIEI